MSINTAFVPGPKSEFVGLGRSPVGKLFKKQILHFGNFAHPNIPGEKLKVTPEVGRSLVKNFHDGVCDIVQIPVVDDANRHVEDPMRNIGEVVDLTLEDDGVYAVMDVRKEQAAEELGKTLIGVSALMHMNYTDTRTGEKVGPTLLHTAVTNRPYITNLKDYEQIIAASADTLGDEIPAVLAEKTEEVEVTEPKEITVDEAKAALAAAGIDVDALQEAASRAPETDRTEELVTALSNVLADAGVIELSKVGDEGGEGPTIADVAEAVIELSAEKRELDSTVATLKEQADALRLSNAENEVDGYIKAGKVLPKQRDVYIKLAMNDRDTLSELLPEDAIVALSEEGVTTHDEPDSETFEKHAKEVERLVSLANENTGRS